MLDIEILQIDIDKDSNNVCFMEYENTIKIQGKVDLNIYKSVFKGIIKSATLDDIVLYFNYYQPKEFKGHSLSVSDIIVLNNNSQKEYYFINNNSFVQIK